MDSEKKWIPYLFILPALMGLTIFKVLPIFVSLIGGFTKQNILGEVSFVGFQNYIQLFKNPNFWNSTKITLIFNVIINPLQIFLAFLLALLVKKDSRGIGLFRTAYFVPMTTSLAVASILWKLILDQNIGMANGFLTSLGFAAQPFSIAQTKP